MPQVAQAKKSAYPDGIEVTELKCEVPFQNLLHYTVTRLMAYLNLQFENKQLLLVLREEGTDFWPKTRFSFIVLNYFLPQKPTPNVNIFM